MRLKLYPLVAVLFAVFLLGMPLLAASSVSSASSSSSSNQGYVTYQVTIIAHGNQSNFIVNESSEASSTSGFDLVSLSLTSNLQNLTYSRPVNTSSIPEIFPFIPGVSNQSLSYSTHGIAFTVQFSSAGTSSISYNGANYNGAQYLLSFSVANMTSGQTMSASGTLVAFPSGLLYSANMQGANPNTSVTVKLVRTSLPLTDPSNKTSATEGTAIVGAGVLGALAIAIPWRFRRKKSLPASSGTSDEKPAYWVD